MSVSRARTALAGARTLVRPVRRQYSDHHHHETPYESTGPETLFGPAFQRAFVGGSLLYGVYYFLPSGKDEHNALTNFISNTYTPVTVWSEINTARTAHSAHLAEGKILTQVAEKPAVQRHRFPSMLDMASPRLVAVGSEVDFTNFVARRDDQ